MSSQNIRGSITHPRRQYADLVESIYGDTQKWLIKFLRNGYDERYWEGRDPHIDIYILDDVDGHLSCESFRPYRVGEVDSRFIETLDNRPSNSTTRLLLFQCSQLGDTNSAYLDAVGWKFKLHPMFFCAHLQGTLYLSESRQMMSPTELPVALPSEVDWISVETDSNSFMTAHVTESTVIVLGVDYFDGRVKKLQNVLMNESLFPRINVVEAASTPYDFLLPYVQSSLRDSARLARTHGRMKPKLEQDRRVSSFDWEWNQSNYRNLLKSKNSIMAHFQKRHGNLQSTSSRLRTFISDYDSLIQETRENASQLQSMLQNYTSRQAIKEAQKSLDQADAVRRITIVGIVFIPLSFAASVFGMNVEQLGTGTTNLGYFFLVAIISSLLAIVLAANVKPVERFWAKARNSYGEREFNFADDYGWVSKSMVFWGWIRHRSSFATKIYDLWWTEKNNQMEESGNFHEEEIPHFKWTVTLHFFVTCLRKIRKSLNIFSFRISEQRPSAEATNQHKPSSDGTQ